MELRIGGHSISKSCFTSHVLYDIETRVTDHPDTYAISHRYSDFLELFKKLNSHNSCQTTKKEYHEFPVKKCWIHTAAVLENRKVELECFLREEALRQGGLHSDAMKAFLGISGCGGESAITDPLILPSSSVSISAPTPTSISTSASVYGASNTDATSANSSPGYDPSRNSWGGGEPTLTKCVLALQQQHSTAVIEAKSNPNQVSAVTERILEPDQITLEDVQTVLDRVSLSNPKNNNAKALVQGLEDSQSQEKEKQIQGQEQDHTTVQAQAQLQLQLQLSEPEPEPKPKPEAKSPKASKSGSASAKIGKALKSMFFGGSSASTSISAITSVSARGGGAKENENDNASSETDWSPRKKRGDLSQKLFQTPISTPASAGTGTDTAISTAPDTADAALSSFSFPNDLSPFTQAHAYASTSPSPSTSTCGTTPASDTSDMRVSLECVYANGVHVRDTPSKHAQHIGSIDLGDTVSSTGCVKTDRDSGLTFVEIRSSPQHPHGGWVPVRSKHGHEVMRHAHSLSSTGVLPLARYKCVFEHGAYVRKNPTFDCEYIGEMDQNAIATATGRTHTITLNENKGGVVRDFLFVEVEGSDILPHCYPRGWVPLVSRHHHTVLEPYFGV